MDDERRPARTSIRAVLLLIVVTWVASIVFGACGEDTLPTAAPPTPFACAQPQSPPQPYFGSAVATSVRADGLYVGDVKKGSGPAAKDGDTLVVAYTGWLCSNGTVFDSSGKPGGQTFKLPLGQHQAIAGWDEGLVGIQAGGQRRLIIPPQLGYGASPPQGGQIPANATLVFDVQVITITPAGASPSGSPGAAAPTGTTTAIPVPS